MKWVLPNMTLIRNSKTHVTYVLNKKVDVDYSVIMNQNHVFQPMLGKARLVVVMFVLQRGEPRDRGCQATNYLQPSTRNGAPHYGHFWNFPL